MSVSLDQYCMGFLRTGRLGSVWLGASRDNVLEFLNAPVTAAPAKKAEIHVFNDGVLEVAFKQGQVIGFGLYFREPRTVVSLPGIDLSSAVTSRSLQAWLTQSGIDWKHRELDLVLDAEFLDLKSGVAAKFEDGHLDSLLRY